MVAKVSTLFSIRSSHVFFCDSCVNNFCLNFQPASGTTYELVCVNERTQFCRPLSVCVVCMCVSMGAARPRAYKRAFYQSGKSLPSPQRAVSTSVAASGDGTWFGAHRGQLKSIRPSIGQ